MSRLLEVLDRRREGNPLTPERESALLAACVADPGDVDRLRRHIGDALTLTCRHDTATQHSPDGHIHTARPCSFDGCRHDPQIHACIVAQPRAAPTADLVAVPDTDRADIAVLKHMAGDLLVDDVLRRPAPVFAATLVPTGRDGYGTGYAAYLTTQSWYTGRRATAEHFEPYLDPRHWPCCSDFFQAMVPEPDPHPDAPAPPLTVADRVVGAHWQRMEGVLNEQVGFGDDRDLFPRTLLRFWRKRRPTLGNPARTSITLRYELVEPTDSIVVDEGDLAVTEVATELLCITTTKKIKFSGRGGASEGQSTASLAGPLGWLDGVLDLVQCTTSGRHALDHLEPPRWQTP